MTPTSTLRGPFDRDASVRSAAFRWLDEQVSLRGDVLEWGVLLRGFDHGGERVPLVSQQGIFKPRLLELPLSVRTSPGGPYDDEADESGSFLRYRYRGVDPEHRDNRGLVVAMEREVPLVYLHGVDPGRYLVTWPVYVVGADAGALAFTIQLDRGTYRAPGDATYDLAETRRYGVATLRRRLHQEAFRIRVLRAYRESCAMCRLRHRELLDAAHIVPDREPEGDPRVSNGLALCKLHHAAFDNFFVTVDTEYRVVVRSDILDEEDGPMLLHGLQRLDGCVISLPRREESRPSRDALAERLELFRRAG